MNKKQSTLFGLFADGMVRPVCGLPAVFVLVLSLATVHAGQPPIAAIAFAPQGECVIVGSQAGLRVLRWPDLSVDRQLATHLENLHDLQFSHDGRRLAVAGGTPGESGVVELFAWPEGRLLWRSTCHADLVYALTWSEDGAFLATAASDRNCLVLDTQSGETWCRLAGHSRPVTTVVFLPGGQQLVTAGVDHSLRVWDVGTGQTVRRLENHTGAVVGLAVRDASGNGTLPLIASVGSDRTVRLWQPTIGRMVRFARLTSPPLCVGWAQGGSRIVAGCQDGQLHVLDPDTGEVVQELAAVNGWAHSLAVHPRGRSVLVGGSDGQLTAVELPERG